MIQCINYDLQDSTMSFLVPRFDLMKLISFIHPGGNPFERHSSSACNLTQINVSLFLFIAID